MVCAQTSGGTTVYKHVDEQGRVTYSNSPVRGATPVELQPITVVRSGLANAPAALPRAIQANAAAADAPVATQTPVERAPVPSFEQAPKSEQPQSNGVTPAAVVEKPRDIEAPREIIRQSAASGKETASTAAASSTISTAALVRQRRDDVRRRIIEGEIEAETQMLSDARLELQREQAKSPAMRSLRAALSADPGAPRANDKQPDQDTIIAKSLVERHFARIRDLQDVVAMHEGNVAELRALLPAQSKPPVAKVVATRSLSVQR